MQASTIARTFAAVAVAATLGSVAIDAGAQTPAATRTPPATAGTANPKDEMTVVEPVLMLVPMQVSMDPAQDKGCWAKLYDHKNFTGDSFKLVGPIDLARMRGPFGFNWENKVRSIETGPKTQVTIYDNRDFKDQDKAIAAGQKVGDLSKKMGFFDDFRSMKMTCSA